MKNIVDVSKIPNSVSLSRQEAVFKAQVKAYNKDIPYNKNTVNEQIKAISDYYHTLAVETGVTIDIINSDTNIIQIIHRAFTYEALILLCDKDGKLVLNEPERLILFYHYYKARGTEEQKKTAEAISYILLSRLFSAEVEVINKVAGNGNIKATQMVLDARNFDWRRCPYIFRGYMSVLGIADHPYEKENKYVIETHKQGYLGILIDLMGYTKEKAIEHLKKQKEGLFYTFLPIEVEARLLKHILTNTMVLTRNPKLFNGACVPALLAYERQLMHTQSFNESSNAYVNIIRHYKIRALGLYMEELSASCKRAGTDDVFIYALSDGYFAFTMDMPLHTVSPVLANKAYTVNYFPFDLDGYFV